MKPRPKVGASLIKDIFSVSIVLAVSVIKTVQAVAWFKMSYAVFLRSPFGVASD